ncbi:hypothetical protein ACJX0J_007643, partial [Zea mays]
LSVACGIIQNLSEVEEKMEKFEKEKEADAKRIADLEYALSIQVGLHRSEVEGLEKKLDEITENFNEIFISQPQRKESHTALEEASKAEEAVECERLIGIFLIIIFREIFRIIRLEGLVNSCFNFRFQIRISR